MAHQLKSIFMPRHPRNMRKKQERSEAQIGLLATDVTKALLSLRPVATGMGSRRNEADGVVKRGETLLGPAGEEAGMKEGEAKWLSKMGLALIKLWYTF